MLIAALLNFHLADISTMFTAREPLKREEATTERTPSLRTVSHTHLKKKKMPMAEVLGRKKSD